MKFAPLILSLSCLGGGIACLALGHPDAGMALIAAFAAQFVPSAHKSLTKGRPDA